jgi:hypothetical protein
MIDFCVLCLSNEYPLTVEHIFPEAIGGRIQFPILCAKCNSDVGRKIDAPFLNQKNIQLARLTFGIAGKSGQLPQPFSENYATEIEGVQTHFKIRTDFSVNLIPSAPEISVGKDRSVTIKLNRDVEFSHQIPKILENSLRRFFASEEGRSLRWKSDEIENAICKSIASVKKTEPVKTHITAELSGKWEIDLRRLFVEHVKILYEIACIESKGSFARTSKGEKVRSFLYELSKDQHQPSWGLNEKALELEIAPDLPEHLIQFSNILANQEAHSFHMAIVSKYGVIVNTLGIGAMMPTAALLPDDATIRIYINSIKDQNYGIYDL